MEKDRIIIHFKLFSAILCDSNDILNVKIEQVGYKRILQQILYIVYDL